jgi:hypothetical protein
MVEFPGVPDPWKPQPREFFIDRRSWPSPPAAATGEAAALVDLGDHFDPQAAEAAGVSLPRLLWLRPRTLRQALLSAETAVTAGVPLVLLDLGLAPSRLSLAQRARPDVAFLRLARAARAHARPSSSSRPGAGAAARIVLAAERARPFWHRGEREASPPLLLGLSARLVPEKLPGHRPGAAEAVALCAADALPGDRLPSNHATRLSLRPDVPARRAAP